MLTVNELFANQLKCVNLGLESFYDALKIQGVTSAHVEWKPPAGGDMRLIEILAKLNADD